MKQTLVLAVLLAAGGSIALAQGKGGPPQPPLMECGVHGDIDIICGTRSPEDLELTPDGKYIIVSQFVGGPAGHLHGLPHGSAGRKRSKEAK